MGSGTRRTPSEEEIKGATEQRASPIKPGGIFRSANATDPYTVPAAPANQSILNSGSATPKALVLFVGGDAA
jgi:hypothetical protein